MSITIERILAPAPATTRGQFTHLSVDPKGQRVAYAAGKSIFVRSIDDPTDCKEYTAHTCQTTIARFSPSGFYIASGDVSGTVRVWDANGCVNTKGEYKIISGRINDIAWDGDSQRIIAVGDGRQRYGHCFTADSGNSVGEIIGHSQAINSVSIRQQRPLRAVTVSDDRNVVFMRGAPFQFENRHATLHKGFVFGAAFAPDGSAFVTVSADKRIQLYDGLTGEPTKQIGENVHTGSVFSVAWSPDSRKLVTASADRSVRLWNVESGKELQVWRFGPEGAVSVPDQQVGVVYPSGRTDGLILALNLNGDLTYLHEGSEVPNRIIHGHSKAITAFSIGSEDSGKSVWTGSFDGRVCHWDIASGECIIVDGQTHSNQVSGFSWVPGRTFSVGWDDTLRTLDESANTYVGSAVKLTSQPKAVSATGNAVYVALASNSIAVYKGEELVAENPLPYSPTTLAAHKSTVAVGADDNSLHVYKADAAGNLEEQMVLQPVPSVVSALAFSKDGSLLGAGYANGRLVAFETTGSWPIATDRWTAHSARISSIAWNSKGTHAVTGSLDTNIYVWSLTSPGFRVKAAIAHKDGVNGVCWADNDSKVVSSGGDACVKIWNVVLS